jgi:hypothetical protein
MRRIAVRRPSPALLVAIAALVVATAGGSIAATSNPVASVSKKRHSDARADRKALRAYLATHVIPHARLANKASAAKNATHATSADTATAADTALGLGTLPSGHSESGVWSADGGDTSGDPVLGTIQFPIPLAAPMDGSHTIYDPGAAVEHCPGRDQADRGYLCAYRGDINHVTFFSFARPGTTMAQGHGADRTGSVIYFTATGSDSRALGTWTLTAP